VPNAGHALLENSEQGVLELALGIAPPVIFAKRELSCLGAQGVMVEAVKYVVPPVSLDSTVKLLVQRAAKQTGALVSHALIVE